MKKNRKKIILISSIVFLSLILISGVYYFWQNESDVKINTKEEIIKEQKQEETKSILEKVGELVTVPEETPIVSRIVDINQSSLKQPFFKGAKNGDYLLIYKATGKAILYSETQNKILNMGPFSATTSQI